MRLFIIPFPCSLSDDRDVNSLLSFIEGPSSATKLYRRKRREKQKAKKDKAKKEATTTTTATATASASPEPDNAKEAPLDAAGGASPLSPQRDAEAPSGAQDPGDAVTTKAEDKRKRKRNKKKAQASSVSEPEPAAEGAIPQASAKSEPAKPEPELVEPLLDLPPVVFEDLVALARMGSESEPASEPEPDEFDRELEQFKQFCNAPISATRQKVRINIGALLRTVAKT